MSPVRSAGSGGKPPRREDVVKALAVTALVSDLFKIQGQYDRAKITAAEYVERTERRIAEFAALLRGAS